MADRNRPVVVKRPYPDNWPWDNPMPNRPDRFPIPLEGFDYHIPEDGVGVAHVVHNIRDTKKAFGSAISIPAVFSCDVEDGDIVIPLPCKCDDDEVCNELLCVLRDIQRLPDAIWVPAYRETTDDSVSLMAIVDLTTYEPPFYGVAYKKLGRVMVGPIVAHPRYKFHTGDRLYADKNGNLTTTANGKPVGVCLAPGSFYLLQYATVLKNAFEDLETGIINEIENKGVYVGKTTVTVPDTTTERNLEDRFGDIVNIKDFGAKGDGITDDTAAFQAVIAYMQELSSDICLFIPPGTYLTTELPSVPCYGPGSIKYNDTIYSPFELLFTIDGAIQKDDSGRYTVNFSDMSKEDLIDLISQIVQDGGGLGIDENGNIYVDFSLMPTEKFEELLQSIRVPIWLSADKIFYVNGVTGSDELHYNKGTTREDAFQSIQACVNYVTDNYNLSNYNVYIYCDSVETNKALTLPKYNTTSGTITITKDPECDDIYGLHINISDAYYAVSCIGGIWTMYDFEASIDFANPVAYSSTHPICVNVTNADASLLVGRCRIYGKCASGTNNIISLVRCAYGLLEFIDTTELEASGSYMASKGYAMTTESSGTIRHSFYTDSGVVGYGHLKISGSYRGVIYANGGNFTRSASRLGTIDTSGIVSASEKYKVQSGGSINTYSGGADYFGTKGTAVVESETYSWYK